MTEDDSFEFYVNYYKTPFAHWIPRSHIRGECTKADLNRVPARTPEEVINEKKIAKVEEQAEIWNLVGEYNFENNTDQNTDLKKKPRKIKMQKEVFLGLNIRLFPAYPSEYMSHHGAASVLYLCDKCFYPHLNKSLLYDHMETKCKNFKQPGRMIYQEAEGDVLYKFYELDGSKNEKYCQQLCLFAKFFIQSKTVCYTVKNFMFYILTKTENDKEQIIGYFSKNRNFAKNPKVYFLLILLLLMHY